MYTNDKIELLIRATRLYCYNMYQEYDSKFYPTIKNVILGFTNKIFGTKSKADRMNIDIFSTFKSKPEWGPGWQVYSGIRIYIKFPDTSALEYELLKYPTKHQWEINTTLLKFLHQLRPNK